jgi:secernin
MKGTTMGGDMVAAVGSATTDGMTLFGHNALSVATLHLVHQPSRLYAPGEQLRVTFVSLPQVRETFTTLGARPEGAWGYAHGVNCYGVAAGCTRLRTTLRLDEPGLTGPDLVRLTLERSRTALSAVQLLADLITRHGQGAFPGCPSEVGDCAILVADPLEAFLIEAGGRAWVRQDIGETRAESDLGTVRQDWDRIAPGLASNALERGLWPEDGSKLDFAAVFQANLPATAGAWGRWGRATSMLALQSGSIDPAFIRFVLRDHHEQAEMPDAHPLCIHSNGSDSRSTSASLVVVPGAVSLAWWAPGPPCAGIYFPIVVEGDLPSGLTLNESTEEGLTGRLKRLHSLPGGRRNAARAALAGLQDLYDADAADFLAEADSLVGRNEVEEVRRLATCFMQHAWEQLLEVTQPLLASPLPKPHSTVSVALTEEFV